MRLVLPLLVLLAPGAALNAQKSELWEGAQYDPAVPTFEKVLGYGPGDRISWHSAINRYMEALASAQPGRMRCFEYAKTWEGRRLIYCAIGSEANIKRIDQVRGAMQRLGDPRKTPEAEAKKLMEGLPAVIWLGYGVHGNEISSPDAAMFTAYHLLAARNDKLVGGVLANSIVLIDPSQNPDGRDRFVHHFEQNEGPAPDPSPAAAEHNEQWPGGRTNHYYFDMNRDWFALTQPETRGRVKALLEWLPLVFVDLHEMGSDSTYYFAPEAIPFNPHLAKDQRDALEWFGRNNAKWFDQLGFSYFTREVYDAFYPGYGASWPSYYGSVAMTYEQASARGLVMRRRDETLVRFRDTVRQHFVASISTAETAAANREKLLANFYRYRQTAVEEGARENVKAYVLARRGDISAVDKLAGILAEQGVEVRRVSASFRVANTDYPAGSYVVSLAQPAKRLIRTLLDPDVPIEAEFMKEQERRRRRRLPDQIYDVVAWSLPLQYNVELGSATEVPAVASEPVVAGKSVAGSVTGNAARPVAWLVPWGTQGAGRLLAAALRENLRVWTADLPFTQGERRYGRGTLIIKAAENSNAAAVVRKLAEASGVEVHAAESGWVEEGINFGSNNVIPIRKPAVALAWDMPTASNSAGHTRFVIERQFGYPVTIVRTSRIASTDLGRFHVLILPNGGAYADVLGAGGLSRISEWVSSGGTLIAVGGAVAYLANPRVNLLSVRQENVVRAPDAAKPAPAAKPAETSKPADTAKPDAAAADTGRVAGKLYTTQADFERAILPDSESPDAVPGVLARATVDPDHWLTAGVQPQVYALVQGSSIYTPIKLDKGVNAAVFAGPNDLLGSGYMWEENRKQLAYKPLAVVERQGRGFVIGFMADPNFRAYMDGLNVLFLNAIFRGAGRTAVGGEE